MFRFRLQTLLRLRIADRDDRRGELARALRAADILREQRTGLAEEIAENQALSRRLGKPGEANVDSLLQAHRYEAILNVRSQQLAAQEAQVASEVERRRQTLTEADRQVRVLEKLQERQREEYERGERRREVRLLDEVATANFIRRQEASP